MLNVNDLRNGAVFREGSDLFQVITYEHIKTGRGSGNIKVKVRNLRSGSIVEKSFVTGGRVDEADVQKKLAQFLYGDGETYNFMDPKTYEQFSITSSIVGDQGKYLKDGLEINLIVSGEEALSLELPNSINYTIAETGPSERGNTVSNVYKDATMDNGLIVKVPMFMDAGEKIKVDTRSGEYVERVK
jgi:elongation factor P